MNHVITETLERTLAAVCLCVGITVLVQFEGQWSEHEQINREKTNIQEENI